MAEYIERENLLRALPPKCNMGDMYATAYNTCLNIIENLIKEQPTADAVPVVRCKDCKHYKTDSYYCQKTKQGYCELDNNVKQKQGYCSYGERRCE